MIIIRENYIIKEIWVWDNKIILGKLKDESISILSLQ